MKCSRCQQDNPVPDAQFCPRCGAPIKHADMSGPPAASFEDLLEQQAATSEILRVIARSPGELQSVLDGVAETAARVCRAQDALILVVESDVLRVVAHHGPMRHLPKGTVPLVRGVVPGRAVLDRRVIHVADVQREIDDFPEGSALARQFEVRTTLAVPLLRDIRAIGAILIRRTEVRPFTDREIELLQTFADQAVIAIENVRLFNETKEALERQTATADILRVISQSPTDVQPVFEAIARSACACARALSL
jgi:two-component system NtrC family sensor kinase